MADRLVGLIDETLWNEQLNIYCNLDPATSQQITIRTWTGLLPAMLGFCSRDRIDRVVEKSVMNEAHFLRPSGLATVAASEQLYNQARRGLYGRAIVSNWQGPVWILPNAIVVRGLLSNGYKKQGKEIALRCLSVLTRGLRETGTLHENYDAETGRPLWAPQFISWNSLAMEFFDLLGF
jgi:putative isomerase